MIVAADTNVCSSQSEQRRQPARRPRPQAPPSGGCGRQGRGRPSAAPSGGGAPSGSRSPPTTSVGTGTASSSGSRLPERTPVPAAAAGRRGRARRLRASRLRCGRRRGAPESAPPTRSRIAQRARSQLLDHRGPRLVGAAPPAPASGGRRPGRGCSTSATVTPAATAAVVAATRSGAPTLAPCPSTSAARGSSAG